MKMKRINYKIREQRDKGNVYLYDFPIKVRNKPTNRLQRCYVCYSEFVAGDRQILLNSGIYLKGAMNKPFRAVSKFPIFTSTRSQGLIVPRTLYLHPNCFGCILNFTMKRADLPQLINSSLCGVCTKRFNCFTGNFDESRMFAEKYEKMDEERQKKDNSFVKV